MHFFAEYSKLTDQDTQDLSFGPIGDEQDKYSVGTTFILSEEAKIFACQDSMMIVQPYVKPDGNTDPDLVNVILSPNSGLDISFSSIKYYIYRGIKKDSFISNNAIIPLTSDSTEFITKFWQRWEQFKTDTNLPGDTPPPTPQSFGFETSLPVTTLLEEIYNNEASNNTEINDLQAINVTEGEWIANAEGELTIEIITDIDHLVLDLAYVRKYKHIIDISGFASATPQEKFTLKAEKEKILNYIDPAALIGMHYNIGINVTTYEESNKNTSEIKSTVLYSQILKNFFTKDRVYLDIRSEKGYNYNYYDNYGDEDGFIVERRYAGQMYEYVKYDDWPIMYLSPWIDLTTDSPFNYILFKLRVDDNSKPLLFIENEKLLGENNKENYVKETELLNGTDPEWTKEIKIQIPNYTNPDNSQEKNLYVAHHIKLQYFRQEDNPVSPNTVFKSEKYLDSVFGGIHFPAINIPTVFLNQKYAKRLFVKGSNFEYITENSLLTDTDRVVFLTRNGYSLKKSQNVYPKIDFSIFQTNKITTNPTFPQNLAYNKWEINDGTNTIGILDIVGYNKEQSQTIPIEDIFILGLTKSEWNILDTVSGISDLHQKYIYFEEIPNQSDVDTGTPYKKYKLKVQGLNDSGVVTTIAPTTDVFVYGTGLNLLVSKDFANNTDIPNLIPDSGTFDEGYVDVCRFDYDGNDSIVTDIFPSGIVTVQDKDITLQSRKVGIIGEIHYPVDTIGGMDLSNKKNSYPLIVIIHGNGHRYSDYRHLASHLAKNGFIVTCISCLIKSKRNFKLELYSDYSLQIYYTWADDALYVYNNNPNIDTPYLKYEKLSVVNYEHDLNTGDGVSLLTWIKGSDFNITVNGTTPEELIFLFDVGKHGMASLGRANLLYSHLQIVKSKFGNKVENNIGILGHSRGGEAVIRVAKDIQDSTAPTNLKNINAILSLAPTDMWDEENLTQSIPYFVLYGSRDGDVNGFVPYPRQNGSNDTMGSGAFSLYDRVNNSKEKSMAFVYGATHNGFITDNHDYHYEDETYKAESKSVQKSISSAYINAFFRTFLKNENIWQPIFSEAFIPKSVNKRDIYLQYQNPSGRILIADFKNISESELNLLITVSNGFKIKKTELNLRGYEPNYNLSKRHDPFSPHYYDGLFIEYPSAGGYVIINIPVNKRNVSVCNFLSFRICYVTGGYLNENNREIHKYKLFDIKNLNNLEVQLEDSVNKYKTILPKKIPKPYPRINKTVPLGNHKWNDFDFLTKSAFMTIRIPLSEYSINNVDLTDIRKITLIFPTTSFGGVLTVDDIEFTN